MAHLESVQDRITLRNGYGIPCVGFGTWKMPDGEVGLDALHQALADGYRHIDTAAAYDNEATVGKALAVAGIPREELFVTTKVWNTDRGYDATLKGVRRVAQEAASGLRGPLPCPLAGGPGPRRAVAADERGHLASAGDALRGRQGARHRREQLQAAPSGTPHGQGRDPSHGEPGRAASGLQPEGHTRVLRPQRHRGGGVVAARERTRARKPAADRHRSQLWLHDGAAVPALVPAAPCHSSAEVDRCGPHIGKRAASSGSTSPTRTCSASTGWTRSAKAASIPTRWISRAFRFFLRRGQAFLLLLPLART